MVRLSKPGQQCEYVSYLDKIDDEDVLKGLDALRRRAINAAYTSASPSKSQADFAATTPKRSSTHTPIRRKPTESVSPMTPESLRVAPKRVTSSPSTPKMGPRTMSKRSQHSSTGSQTVSSSSSSSASCTTSTRASPPSIQESMAGAKSRDSNKSEFVPKWKLAPRIEAPRIPEWQLRTMAEERAVKEAVKSKENPSYATTNNSTQTVKQKAEPKNPLLETPMVTPTKPKMERHLRSDCKSLKDPIEEDSKHTQCFGISFSRPYSPAYSFEPEVHAHEHDDGQFQVEANTTSDTYPNVAPKRVSSGLCFASCNPNEFGSTAEATKYSALGWKSYQASPRNLALEQNVPGNRVHSIYRTASEERRERRKAELNWLEGDEIIETGCCNKGLTIAGFVESSERASHLFNKVGCFGAMDQIIEPKGDDFDERFTYCSQLSYGDDEEEKSLPESCATRSTLFSSDTFDYTEADNESSNKSFLGNGRSEPVQLQFVSNFLSNMEDKLQTFSGYRRRVECDRRKVKNTLETVSQQIDDTNKLILRTVEDFIDKQLLSIGQEETSVSTESWAEFEDYTFDGTVVSILSDGNASLVVPHSISFDADYQSSSPTLFNGPAYDPANPETEGVGTSGSNCLESPASLIAGKMEFLSADNFTETKIVPTSLHGKERIASGLVCSHPTTPSIPADRDDKSVRSSKSNNSRTTLGKNLSRALSLSPKRKKRERPIPETMNTKRGIAHLDKTQFVSAQHDRRLTSSLPPLKPRPSVKGAFQLTSFTKTPTMGERVRKRFCSFGSDKRIMLHQAYEGASGDFGIESIVVAPECGTSVVISADDNSVTMIQETYDEDYVFSGVESVFGMAGVPLMQLSVY